MNAIQAKFSSPRFHRLLIGLGAVILAAGAAVLVSDFVGGSDKTAFGPDKGFNPTLPANSTPLKNPDGRTVRTFWQLDPTIRSNIRTFIATAVARKHLEKSWAVTAPSMKADYTYAQWKKATALPVVPYPVDDVDKAQYYLDYASTTEILVEVGLSAPRAANQRPTTFQIGLLPVGQGTQRQWLVDYWMPRWTPPLPVDQ
jgi:hypothetical protein